MILDNTTAIIYLKDLESRFLLVNQAYKNCFGLTSEQAIGRSPTELFGEKVGQQIRANDLAVMRSKAATQFEETITVNGKHFTYLSVKSPLYDTKGDIYGLCGVSTDVSARELGSSADEQEPPLVALPLGAQHNCLPCSQRAEIRDDRLSLGKGESVLLVEDDTDVCEFEALLLRTLGYNVLLAKDAVQAKAVLRRSRVDLVVTDLYLPGDSGLDLIKKFNGRNSKTKFILTSGAEPDDLDTETLIFLRKPFELKELADMVRTVLDQPSASEAKGKQIAALESTGVA
jgi:PAS domain S-box-containing protein